jgi:hypothetical protein
MSAVRFAPNAFLELPLRVRPSLHSVPEMAAPARSPRSSLLRRSWLPCSAMTRASRCSGRMLRPSVYRYSLIKVHKDDWP